MATVIEQKVFTSELDIMRLNIIDWNRLNGFWRNPADALQAISSWYVGLATYTIAKVDLREYPVRDDWPGWNHVGAHEPLGRRYWNMFYAEELGELTFSDEPDFYGTFTTMDPVQRFWGDIGKVSASCFAMVQKKMGNGDLWISILDEQTQVIIEPHYDVQSRYLAMLGLKDEEES